MVLGRFFTTPLDCLILTKSSHAFALSLVIKKSDESALEIALEATAEFQNDAVKPIIVAGQKLRVSKACEAFFAASGFMWSCHSGHAIGERPSTGAASPFHRHILGCCQQYILRRDSRNCRCIPLCWTSLR
ncbi:hypothetical protein LWI28_016945 [Acer negundo]|uniref:Uncharacterized protein n=1 Tax=Acer negundo TaxID=4023 RepID=A0AAD5I985_ACENE|nr:hypothetical protein LWI28_016945 [Acer negundo]